MSFHSPRIAQKDYIELVDYTGRIVAPGKKSKISAETPKALDALGLSPQVRQLNHQVLDLIDARGCTN
jgi:hypothetical protein